MKKTRQKLNIRIKINIVIFGLMAIIFAILPQALFMSWLPNDESQPDYAGNFTYVLHDVCPCRADDNDCAGYYACGPDKANLTYNLDNAPQDLLDAAKRDDYFEGMIEANRMSANIMRIYLLCDISYILSFISLVAGVIYWNHNKAVK